MSGRPGYLQEEQQEPSSRQWALTSHPIPWLMSEQAIDKYTQTLLTPPSALSQIIRGFNVLRGNEQKRHNQRPKPADELCVCQINLVLLFFSFFFFFSQNKDSGFALQFVFPLHLRMEAFVWPTAEMILISPGNISVAAVPRDSRVTSNIRTKKNRKTSK